MCASMVMAESVTIPMVQQTATFPHQFNFRSDVYSQMLNHSSKQSTQAYLNLSQRNTAQMFAGQTPGNRPHQFNFFSDVYAQTRK